MWNSMKSVRLSLICTKIVMLLLCICAAFLPFILKMYIDFALIPMETGNLYPFMVILYLCFITAMTALISLHKLLSNIKKEEVFIMRNVRLLRLISWCCFATAFIMVFGGMYYLLLALMAVAFAFIGLILRVVKNVIEEAVHLKTENELTI